MRTIERLEASMIRTAIDRLRRHPRIELLGNLDAPRLAILSFLLRTGDGCCLHPRLVVRLLNDLFGIQSRGGCACAGPYAHRLLGIGADQADAFRDAVLDGYEAVKPGWTRINFSCFIDAEEFAFLLDAIEFVAEHGERFVPQYECAWQTGPWRHARDRPPPQLLALAAHGAPRRAAPPASYPSHIERAHVLARSAAARCGRSAPRGLVSFQC